MKKFVSTILLVAIIAACGLGTFVCSAGDVVYTYVHDTTSTHNAIGMSSGPIAAQYLDIDKPFSIIEVCCPSYNDNVGNLTFVLYNWAGDYEATLQTTPIAEKEWVDFNDNAWIGISAPAGQAYPKGKYMWVLKDGTQSVGLWKSHFDSLVANILQTSYLRGNKSLNQTRGFYG